MSWRNWRCGEGWNERRGLKEKSGGFFFLSQAKFHHGTLIQDQHSSVYTADREGGKEEETGPTANKLKRVRRDKGARGGFRLVEERGQRFTADGAAAEEETRQARSPPGPSGELRRCLHQTAMPSGDRTAGGGVVRTMSSKGTVFCCHGPVPLAEERDESDRRPPTRYRTSSARKFNQDLNRLCLNGRNIQTGDCSTFPV